MIRKVTTLPDLNFQSLVGEYERKLNKEIRKPQ